MDLPTQGMDPNDINWPLGLLACCYCCGILFYCFATHCTCLIQITEDGSHMEPHPAREWIQMTPMDIVNVKLLFYCLLATVHVSSRSWMTAHMGPHPAREWIQMTSMDIITDDGSYRTTPSQGLDPDDTKGHH
eukprot:scaffold250430_cov58-Attheya_sp.AAC.1